MQEIQNLLRNPIIRNGLKLASPAVALGVEALLLIGGIFKRRQKRAELAQLLAMIDHRLAEILEILATTKSKLMRTECEIRAHELLGLLNEWGKRN